MQYKNTLSVLGAGSYGTALAMAVSSKGLSVSLWARTETQASLMQKERQNTKYLPEINLPDTLFVTSNLEECVKSAKTILVVVPSHTFKEVIENIKPYLNSEQQIAFATKGLEKDTGRFLSDVIEDILGKDRHIAALSGPTFAKELAKGMPTAIAVSGNNPDFIKEMCTLMHTKTFRVYENSDLKALQLGGAVKNVIAIAAGMSDGLGFGANARTALITRGLAEMIRLGTTLGASERGFMGLSGLGDLMLTCTDNQSRNRRFGSMLGQGKSVSYALDEIGQVVEGYHMTEVIYELSLKYDVQMPICQELYQVLFNGKSGKQAAFDLLARELKSE